MPTPLDRYIMDSPLPMPSLLVMPTMLELSLEPPMLPLAILEPTLDKLRRNWIADDLNSSFNNKLPK